MPATKRPAQRRQKKIPTVPGVESPLLTVEEAAAYLKCTVTWFRRNVRWDIKPANYGNQLRFFKSDLDLWLAQHREVPR